MKPALKNLAKVCTNKKFSFFIKNLIDKGSEKRYTISIKTGKAPQTEGRIKND